MCFIIDKEHSFLFSISFDCVPKCPSTYTEDLACNACGFINLVIQNYVHGVSFTSSLIIAAQSCQIESNSCLLAQHTSHMFVKCHCNVQSPDRRQKLHC